MVRLQVDLGQRLHGLKVRRLGLLAARLGLGLRKLKILF